MRSNQRPQDVIHPNVAGRNVYRNGRRFNHEGIEYPTVLDLTRLISITFILALLIACGEPMFENAGSKHSLSEDRKACAMEVGQSPAALAYRQNPTAHPDYVSQVFTAVNRCIERKGWKQVRSQQEQMREAITSEKDTDAFVREFEERLASVTSSTQ